VIVGVIVCDREYESDESVGRRGEGRRLRLSPGDGRIAEVKEDADVVDEYGERHIHVDVDLIANSEP